MSITTGLESAYSGIIILASLAISALLTARTARVLFATDNIKASDAMGTATWDFSRSWASNLTAAGSLLGLILGTGAVPAQSHYLSKANYSVLSAFFLGVVVLAPFLYTLFATPMVQMIGTQQQLFNRGRVDTFLVAAILTCWGVLGQMCVLLLLLGEISLASVSDSMGIHIFQLLIGITIIGILFYVPKALSSTIKSQILPRPEEGSAQAKDGSRQEPTQAAFAIL